MPILSRFRRNRHHAPAATQPRPIVTAPRATDDMLTATDWLDLQLLAQKVITPESLANENRLATGLWSWRFFIESATDRQIMARLEQRRLIEATDERRVCARLTTRGYAAVFHLCRHVRLADSAIH